MSGADRTSGGDEARVGAPAASPSREQTAAVGADAPNRGASGRPVNLPDHDCIQRIGSGGFGEVWLARNRHTGRFVAVKALERGRAIELEGIRKFLLSVSDHPNLVPVEHVGQSGEVVYVVMPLADNAREGSPVADPHDYRPYTLESHLTRTGPLPSAEVAQIGARVASALACMHQHGAAHSDVKPPNILRFAGDWRLGDCSLVVFLEEKSKPGFTPGYAPPDGVTGPPADLYGLGVTLLEALTGETPHVGHLPGADRPANDPIRRDPVWKVAERLIAHEGSGRITTADQAAQELEALAARAAVKDEFAHRRTSALLAAAWVVLASLLATTVSIAVTRPLFFQWTSLNDMYWSWLRAGAPSPAAKVLASLDDVAVIAMTDDTPIDALAGELGLAEVSSANLRSLRLMHARMCELLADAEPRAVVWDIVFRTPSEFDDDLASGIDALTNRKIGVVLTSFGWPDVSASEPPIAPALWATRAKWGSNHIVKDRAGAIWFPLVVERDIGDWLPGIVLSAYAAARRPDAWFDVSLDRNKGDAVVTYWTPTPERPGDRRILGEADRLTVTLIQDREAGPRIGTGPGLREGDRLGLYLASVAPDDALQEATIEYADILRATPDARRAMLRDRVVVIGDFRAAAGDVTTVPERGDMPGPHILASAIESVLASGGSRSQTKELSFVTMWLTGLATGAGVAMAFAGRKRRAAAAWLLSALSLAGVGTLVVVAAWIGFKSYGYLYTPLPALLAAVLTFALVAALLTRVRIGRAGAQT